MKKFALLLSLAVVCSPALAMDCPYTFGSSNYLDQVTQGIKKSQSCYDAQQLAEACALGASGDVAIAGAAQDICAKDFASKLNAADQTTYKNLQNKCDAKYAKMEGTMYISADAFCHLQVAELYSELFTPAE